MNQKRNRYFIAGGVAAAIGISILVATQNYYVLGTRGRPTPWAGLFLGELPVWFAWLAMTPAIGSLARVFPPHQRPIGRNLAVHAAAGSAAILIMLLVTTGLRRITPGAMGGEGPLLETVARSYPANFVPFLIVYAAITAVALAWQSQAALRAQEVRESQLEMQLARTRLDVLRAQLQPHFLFNTLHAISALMGRDVNAARRMMRRLSELLRVALDETDGDEVELAAELDFLDRYLDIQRLRFGDRLNVEFQVDSDTRSLPVPRLILQPLVENAIHHGIAQRLEAETLRIEAERDDAHLLLRVVDDGPGFRTGGGGRGGLGLTNTRERLAVLYGADASLNVLDTGGSGAIVELRIPVREGT